MSTLELGERLYRRSGWPSSAVISWRINPFLSPVLLGRIDVVVVSLLLLLDERCRLVRNEFDTAGADNGRTSTGDNQAVVDLLCLLKQLLS